MEYSWNIYCFQDLVAPDDGGLDQTIWDGDD